MDAKVISQPKSPDSQFADSKSLTPRSSFSNLSESASDRLTPPTTVASTPVGRQEASSNEASSAASNAANNAASASRSYRRHYLRILRVKLVNLAPLIEQGQPYMVLEYFDGSDLSDVLKKAGGVSLATALDIAEQICLGLQYAHGQGVLPRDSIKFSLSLSQEVQRENLPKAIGWLSISTNGNRSSPSGLM